MTKSAPKLVLSSSRDIPFSQLVLSQKNVRRVKSGLSIEDLAEDIYRRTLLQSLNVRPVIGDDGKPNGMFEVPAGGRRFRALELLVKSRRMAKDQPVPCVVREAGIAEEDSLAENVMRVGLHPLDQFRAFSALIEAGLSEEDIAARFFVSVSTVRQRLRLASVSPALLDVYGEDAMTLEQLIAFSVTDNHIRQEQVWEQVNKGPHVPAFHIRRLLTEEAVAATDRRARFIGLNAYTEAGGYVMRDLFSSDEDGWLQDTVLVEQLVSAKLARLAEDISAEGWKWVEAAIDLPYGCEAGKRRVIGTARALSTDEKARLDALVAEFDAMCDAHGDVDELPEDVDTRLTQIEGEIGALNRRPVVYDPQDMAHAGVFISLAHDGTPRIDRGYVRPSDELAPASDTSAGSPAPAGNDEAATARAPATVQPIEKGEDASCLLPDRLVSELTAVRTVALSDALACAPQTAFVALLHALWLSVLRVGTEARCIQIGVSQVWLGTVAPGLRETVWSGRIQQRHEHWAERLPDDSCALWDAITTLSADEKMALLAHCVSLGVNALFEPVKGYDGRVSAQTVARRIAAADRLAQELGLDMAEAGWVTTAENYLGRVTKPQIVEVVREARGEDTAMLIGHLKKADMAREAERLLEGTGWLPEPLRIPGPGPQDADFPDFLKDQACDPGETIAVAAE